MKQAVDDVYIDAFVENEVKPNFLYDIILYVVRLLYVVCGFASYFLYKDYFSGKEMILMLCVTYYLLCGVDYLINFFFIQNCFLIGSLPSGSKFCGATHFRASSVSSFGSYDYSLTVSAQVGSEKVSYEFVKPIANYFEKDGTVQVDIIHSDAAEIMEKFRTIIKEKAQKKSN